MENLVVPRAGHGAASVAVASAVVLIADEVLGRELQREVSEQSLGLVEIPFFATTPQDFVPILNHAAATDEHGPEIDVALIDLDVLSMEQGAGLVRLYPALKWGVLSDDPDVGIRLFGLGFRGLLRKTDSGARISTAIRTLAMTYAVRPYSTVPTQLVPQAVVVFREYVLTSHHAMDLLAVLKALSEGRNATNMHRLLPYSQRHVERLVQELADAAGILPEQGVDRSQRIVRFGGLAGLGD